MRLHDDRLPPERAVYLAAKDATYCLWRFDAVTLADLERARPYFESLEQMLSAADEAEFDTAVRQFFFARIDARAEEPDRAILKEIVTAALDDVILEDGRPPGGRRRETALLVVGGILDGIAYAAEAARTAPARVGEGARP